MIEIRVFGTPAPQGSKRPVGIHGGKHIMIESSKRVAPWREAVKEAAMRVLEDESPLGLSCHQTIDGPVVAEMTFTLKKPKSAPKTRRTYPDRIPDLSKLARSTEDALSSAGAWEDDARVVRYGTLAKVYPLEDPDALHVPGAVIRLWSMEEWNARKS